MAAQLRSRQDRILPYRIHTVVRTPNGNDYGKDLLRQRHQRFDHTQPAKRHQH
jgi:hypothetical protein